MPLKTDKRTIGDYEVTVTQMPAMRALSLLPRLGKALAPALSQLTSTGVDIREADVIPALSTLFSSLTPEEAQALVREVNAGTSVMVDGRARDLNNDAAINSVFGGDIASLLKVTAFAMEVNFSDFLAAMPGRAPSAKTS